MLRQSQIDDAFGQGVRRRRVTIVFSVLAVLLVLLASMNLFIGTMNVDLWDILVNRNTDNVNYAIVWNLRLPRLIAAALLGGALALSGFLLQKFFNNPML